MMIALSSEPMAASGSSSRFGGFYHPIFPFLEQWVDEALTTVLGLD